MLNPPLPKDYYSDFIEALKAGDLQKSFYLLLYSNITPVEEMSYWDKSSIKGLQNIEDYNNSKFIPTILQETQPHGVLDLDVLKGCFKYHFHPLINCLEQNQKLAIIETVERLKIIVENTHPTFQWTFLLILPDVQQISGLEQCNKTIKNDEEDIIVYLLAKEAEQQAKRVDKDHEMINYVINMYKENTGNANNLKNFTKEQCLSICFPEQSAISQLIKNNAVFKDVIVKDFILAKILRNDKEFYTNICQNDVFRQTICIDEKFRQTVCADGRFRQTICADENFRQTICADEKFRQIVCADEKFRQTIYTDDKFRQTICADENFRQTVCVDEKFRQVICVDAEFRLALLNTPQAFRNSFADDQIRTHCNTSRVHRHLCILFATKQQVLNIVTQLTIDNVENNPPSALLKKLGEQLDTICPPSRWFKSRTLQQEQAYNDYGKEFRKTLKDNSVLIKKNYYEDLFLSGKITEAACAQKLERLAEKNKPGFIIDRIMGRYNSKKSTCELLLREAKIHLNNFKEELKKLKSVLEDDEKIEAEGENQEPLIVEKKGIPTQSPLKKYATCYQLIGFFKEDTQKLLSKEDKQTLKQQAKKELADAECKYSQQGISF